MHVIARFAQAPVTRVATLEPAMTPRRGVVAIRPRYVECVAWHRACCDLHEMAESNRNSASAFTPAEEEFFRAGATREPTEPIETFEDLDEPHRRRPLWKRLFARKSTQS
jgi:hypothetical protein